MILVSAVAKVQPAVATLAQQICQGLSRVEALFQELDARNEEINNLLTESGSVCVDQYGDPEDD